MQRCFRSGRLMFLTGITICVVGVCSKGVAQSNSPANANTKTETGVAQKVGPDDHADVDQHDYYRATLAAAEKSLRLNEVADARRWLAATPKHLRHWEWSFLQAQTDESASSIQMRNKESTDIKASPDGKYLAIANNDGTIQLVDISHRRVVREIGNHTAAVYSIDFSPDGQRLASVSRDTTARVWDVETGAEISQISLDNPGVAATVFSPDGRLVATCTWLREGRPKTVHGVVWIWDPSDGDVVHRKLVGVKPLDSIDWSADGKSIVVGSWDGQVHVLDATGSERVTLKLPDEGIYNAVISVALDRDGKRVAAGSKDRTARVWNIDDGTLIHTLRDHGGFVNDLAFSSSYKVATACDDGIVRLWDLEEDRLTPKRLRGHERSVDSLCWSSNGKQVYSIGRDKTVRTWDAHKSYGGKLDINAGAEGTYSTTFTPDGRRIYVAMFGGQVMAFDALTGKKVAEFDAHSGSSCNMLAIDGTGRQLLTCSWDKTAKLWSLPNHKLIKVLEAGNGIYHCNLSRDGSRAALCVGSIVQIWDTQNGKKIGELSGHEGGVREVVFDSSGARLATASADKSIGVWDAGSFERTATIRTDNGVNAVTFSKDGRYVASGGDQGTVSIWHTQNGQLLNNVKVSDRTIYRLAFSPHGRRLAVGSNGVSIIDPNFAKPLLKFYPVPDTIWYLEFSPDGEQLAVCTTGGHISICNSNRDKAGDSGR